MGDVRTQKQLVLTTIKTAVVDGGELSLDLFLRVSRYLPSSLSSREHRHLWSQERTTGFIHVNRVYRFTFVDTSGEQAPGEPSTFALEALPGDHRPAMCFSPNPLDTLVRGIFFNSAELKLVLSLCWRHSAAIKARKEAQKPTDWLGRRKTKKDDETVDEDDLIGNVIRHYCVTALKLFDNGEFVRAASWMMLLQAFMSSPRIMEDDGDEGSDAVGDMKVHELVAHGDGLALPPSFCMMQLSSLTARVSGRIQSAVDSIETIISCVGLVIATITSLTTGKYKSNDDALNEMASNVFYKFDSISGFLVELREIILCIHRDAADLHCSDASLVLNIILGDLASIFHSRQLSRPLLPKSEALRIARSGSARDDVAGVLHDMSRALRSLEEPLRCVLSSMQLLRSSIAGDTLLELLQMDADSRHRYKTPYSKQSIREMSQGVLKDYPNLSRASLDVVPKTFSELLGVRVYCYIVLVY